MFVHHSELILTARLRLSSLALPTTPLALTCCKLKPERDLTLPVAMKYSKKCPTSGA